MSKFLQIFSLIFIVGATLLPLKSHAEAEQIYVAWIDIDYMESNPMLGWFEELKDQVADASPFLGQLLLPEESVSGLGEEELSYEDETSQLPS